MSLVPLRIRNIMVRRMDLPEEPVDEFVEALDEMAEGMTPRAELQATIDLFRMEMRTLIYQATFFIIMVILTVGAILAGLLIASLSGG